MTRLLLDEIELDFFIVHDSIVHGVLRKCRISPLHNNYDDYLQIGRLALVNAYEGFPHSLLNEEQFYRFTGYAFQKVYWSLIDELRKEKRNKESPCLLPEVMHADSFFTLPSFESESIERTLINTFMPLLSENEQLFVKESVINGLTITEIAKKHHVSRKTVYLWRNKSGKKYNAHINLFTDKER